MAHPTVNNPVISELDEIAQELEKTGNADLANLVDEVTADLMSSQTRTVAAKSKAKVKPAPKAKVKPKAKKGTKPAKTEKAPTRKSADANPHSRRARIASAMRKIARAQVAELEDIAGELLKEGSKKEALELLRIAEELDSDYTYSTTSKHEKPESKGDASKRYDREKANKPDAKMDADEKENLEYPFGEKGEGYPKKSAFDKQLDKLLRMATEDAMEPAAEDADEEMDLSDESDESMEGLESEDSEDSEESEESETEESEESEDENPFAEGEEGEESEGEDADDLDLSGLDLGDGEDELASMMEAMDEPEDMEASSDRMYESDDAEDGEDEGVMPPVADGPMEDGEEGEEEEMDEAEDTTALDILPNVEVSGPLGSGLKISQAEKEKVAQLAKKLAAKGEKKLASRLLGLTKK